MPNANSTTQLAAVFLEILKVQVLQVVFKYSTILRTIKWNWDTAFDYVSLSNSSPGVQSGSCTFVDTEPPLETFTVFQLPVGDDIRPDRVSHLSVGSSNEGGF